MAGQTDAYRFIIEKYRPYLFQVVLSVVRNPKDAEDVTQEALLKIYYSLSRYRFEGFKTWMTRIAVNQAIDYKRKAFHRKESASDSPEDYAVNEGYAESSEDCFLRREMKEMLQGKLQTVPESYREVIQAFYLEDKSYPEIAADLGLEQKSVESRLYRARQWIRKHWKEEDFR